MSTLYQMSVKRGQKVYSDVSSICAFLGGEDIYDQMISVKELIRAKDAENIKHRGLFRTF